MYRWYTIKHESGPFSGEKEKIMTQREDYQFPPKEGFILTHFLTVTDVKRSAEFYSRILGGDIVLNSEPTILRIANTWLILNVCGGAN